MTQTGLGASSFETAFFLTRTARPEDCDELGHVNNAVYVQWIQDIATAHWFSVAPGPMRDDHVWVCLRHEIDYREPILPGDRVEMRTWLGRRTGPRFDRYTDIRKPGSVKGSVKALTTWVMITRATGRPRRVGDDVLAAFGLDPADHG
ncbi:MAG: acyl-CoA thioesterase [Alphaproteobacteria bacterium]